MHMIYSYTNMNERKKRQRRMEGGSERRIKKRNSRFLASSATNPEYMRQKNDKLRKIAVMLLFEH